MKWLHYLEDPGRWWNSNPNKVGVNDEKGQVIHSSAQAQDKGTAHLSLLKLLDAGSEYLIALAEWSRLLFVEGAL